MTVPTQFRLTPQDKASAVWPKLRAFMEQERDVLRRRNDMQLGDLETAALRGQIAQLSNLIDLDKDRPTPEVAGQF